MTAPSLPEALPPIPNKRYFTIGEVGVLCDVKAHVLRYWEQEFGQLKPTKRQGNRRYYQRHDIELIRQIRGLLYDQGFTIAGARLQLSQARATPSSSPEMVSAVAAAPSAAHEPGLNWDLLSKADKTVLESRSADESSDTAQTAVRQATMAVHSMGEIAAVLDALAEEIALALSTEQAPDF